MPSNSLPTWTCMHTYVYYIKSLWKNIAEVFPQITCRGSFTSTRTGETMRVGTTEWQTYSVLCFCTCFLTSRVVIALRHMKWTSHSNQVSKLVSLPSMRASPLRFYLLVAHHPPIGLHFYRLVAQYRRRKTLGECRRRKTLGECPGSVMCGYVLVYACVSRQCTFPKPREKKRNFKNILWFEVLSSDDMYALNSCSSWEHVLHRNSETHANCVWPCAVPTPYSCQVYVLGEPCSQLTRTRSSFPSDPRAKSQVSHEYTPYSTYLRRACERWNWRREWRCAIGNISNYSHELLDNVSMSAW